MDLKGLGYDSGNYWWYRGTDVDGLYARMGKRMPGPNVDGLFLTITTLKDPGHAPHGHHTLEMFTFVPYGPFERWASSMPEGRSQDYLALKRTLGDKILEAAENVIPRLRDHVKFLEVGTPLTNDFYCETYRGASYGTAKTPFQLGPFSFDQRGPVKNLHFCGASTLSHGVGGASLSGLFAAKNVLEREKADDLLGPSDGSLRIYPADRPEEWRGGGSAEEGDDEVADERRPGEPLLARSLV
jgi:phytoene dehydrogenase-like protein